MEVELGSGDGSFLAAYAAEYPQRNLVGVERLLGRLRKVARKGERNGLQNLRLIRIEASYFLQYLIPARSTDAIHVYFPDPWPKRKQKRRRLVNTLFTELAAKVLRPGGTVYLRTDSQDYFEQMNEVFGQSSEFNSTVTPTELLRIETDFEREFHTRGRRTLHGAFQRD